MRLRLYVSMTHARNRACCHSTHPRTLTSVRAHPHQCDSSGGGGAGAESVDGGPCSWPGSVQPCVGALPALAVPTDGAVVHATAASATSAFTSEGRVGGDTNGAGNGTSLSPAADAPGGGSGGAGAGAGASAGGAGGGGASGGGAGGAADHGGRCAAAAAAAFAVTTAMAFASRAVGGGNGSRIWPSALGTGMG